MAIFKRSGSPHWQIGFSTPNGQRIRRTSGTEDKQAAKQLDVKLQAEIWAQQHLGKKPPKLWIEAVIRWINEKEGVKKSLVTDKFHLRWLSSYLDKLTLDQIDKSIVTHLIEERKKSGKSGRPISNSTVNRMLEVIRAILKRAQTDWEWIDSTVQIKLLPKPLPRDRWETPEKIEELFNELPEHQQDVLIFDVATGLRKGNVLSLEWPKVDFQRKHAYIESGNSKSKKAIPVPLNDLAMAILTKRYLADDKHQRWVFTYKGRRLKQVSTKAWRNALQRAGIDDFKWHDLRHTWASWHVKNGTSLQSLKELGGWSSIQMVLRYAHLSSDHLKEDAERVSDAKLTQLVKNGDNREGEKP